MLKANMKFCLLFIFFYSLVSCITNEKVQRDYCEGLDTYKQGYSDASTGQSAKNFQDIINACVKHEITLDQINYDKGYQAGIKILCTKEKGYDWGVSGQESLGICLNANSEQFSKGYEEGNKKCWYDAGYSHAKVGYPLSKFTDGKCVILSESQSKGEYGKGWKEGAKVFCTHKTGYDWGLTGNSNPGICRGSVFSKGYREGNKKCWYDAGYSHASDGYSSSKFTDVRTCVTVSKKQSWTEYDKGWKKGMKALCTLEGGYNWGLTGNSNPGICPESRSAQFSKGYMKGLQQYEKNKRHQQLLNLKREKIRAEKEQKQRALNLERERIRIEQMQTQQLINLEWRKAREEQQQKQQIINLERRKVIEQQETREEILKLQKLGKRRLCKYNSDCGKKGRCRYDYNVRDYVCTYK